MTTPFEQLCDVAKVKPKAGETFETFARKLIKKTNEMSEKEWDSLGNDGPAQTWHNDTMMFFEKYTQAVTEAKKNGEGMPDIDGFSCTIDHKDGHKKYTGLPELEGYEAVEESAADEATEAEAEAPPEDEKKPAKAAKKAAKKPAKKAKAEAEAEAKPAKKAKAKGPKRGRRSLFEDGGKIKILAKKNPHREGSYRDKNFKKIKDGMTVAEAVKAGCPRQQVWSMLSRKIISVSA